MNTCEKHTDRLLLIRTNSEILDLERFKGESLSYIDDSVQEEEEAGGIAVLSGGYHEVHVAVLDEHVGHAVVVHNRILSLRIGLQQKFENRKSMR